MPQQPKTIAQIRREALRRRHARLRRKIKGVAGRPRLCIHRSSRHIYAQIIDDERGATLFSVTTNTKANKAAGKSFANAAWAQTLGKEIGAKAVAAGSKTVVFDRGGYQYHGVIKAFAEAAREAGLEF